MANVGRTKIGFFSIYAETSGGGSLQISPNKKLNSAWGELRQMTLAFHCLCCLGGLLRGHSKSPLNEIPKLILCRSFCGTRVLERLTRHARLSFNVNKNHLVPSISRCMFIASIASEPALKSSLGCVETIFLPEPFCICTPLVSTETKVGL